jgi:hypothetical protein
VIVDTRDRLPIAKIRLHAHDGRPLDYSDLDWEEAARVGEAQDGRCCE